MRVCKIENEKFGYSLLNYINGSPTMFHAVKNAADMLDGFIELKETDRWKLESGGKYYVKRNNSSLLAFEIGQCDISENGFNIIGAHTDSPNFKIKPGDCIVTSDNYVKLNTEVYGGAILSTWFDRPLSAAGRAFVRKDGRIEEKLINIEKPILIIPNLCIHFQRDVNENCSYNKQTNVLPLLGFADTNMAKGDYILNILSNHLMVENNDILDYELFLYEYDKGILMGANNEFISASRLDNLSMVFCGLQGLINSGSGQKTKILAAFDNEEVGSTTIAGANSSYLTGIIKRICNCMQLDDEGYYTALANSIALSADTGHAVHPNYSDKHDTVLRPVLGGGPTIKYSATQRYATNSETASYFINICEKANVPYQKFAIRSDIVGGSTIGPSISSVASLRTVDIGTSILAMHSVREFGCLVDNVYMAEAFRIFYET